MAPADYAEVLCDAIERDYIPRFWDLGIDALLAWQQELSEQ